MSKRKPVSIYDIVHTFTPEEQAENARIYDLKYKLGLLVEFYDEGGVDNCSLDSKYITVPSPYKTYQEYIIERIEASRLIDSKQDIPQDMYDRLVQAKKELKEQGIPIGYI